MLKINQKYLVNIPEMDDEHAEFISRAEKLMAAYQDGNPQQEILRLLTFLQGYVVEHFQHEEELQIKWQYPEFEEHMRVHDQFKKDIQGLYGEIIENGLTLNCRLKFNYLINEWIYKHIGDDDRKLADFIHSKSNS